MNGLEEYSLAVKDIIKIGSGLGIIIPKKKLVEQGLEEGDTVKVLLKKITKED